MAFAALSFAHADIRAVDTEQKKPAHSGGKQATVTPLSQEAGVVRISSEVEKERRTGTGFIVKIDQENIYIVTAAHVVEGDPGPKVEFFTRQGSLARARIVAIEGGESRGLALLIATADKEVAAGLLALALGSASGLRTGDEMEATGFPAGAGKWVVAKGAYSGTKGRDLLFAGSAGEGSSGGPLTRDGKVVGVITSVTGEFAHASSADAVREFLLGWHISPSLGLRSVASAISHKEIGVMLAKFGFFEAHLNNSAREPVAALQMIAGKGDAIASDPLTGLIWTNRLSSFDMGRAAAKVYVEQLNDNAVGGYRDWRLPTLEELASRLDGNGLKPHRKRYLWSSDTDPEGESWFVDGVDAEITRMKAPVAYVWAVRGLGDISGFH